MRRTCILLAFLTIFAISQTTAVVSIAAAADDYNAAKSAQAKNLRSKEPADRATAIEAIAKTGDVRAVKLTLKTLLKEEDPTAAARMGAALQYCKSDEAIDEIAGDVRKYTGVTKAFPALWALTGVALGESQKGDALIEEIILDTKTKYVYIKTAALEAIAVANRRSFWQPVEKVLRIHDKEWEDNPIAIITACTVASRIYDGHSAFKLVDALADVIEKYESPRVKSFAATTCGTIAGSKPFMDPLWWRYWAKSEGKVGADAEAKRDASSTSVRKKQPEFFGVEAVGNRICFIIDKSGSMESPVSIPPQPKKEEPKEKKGPITGKSGSKKDDKDKKEEVPPPDYSKVKTKLDLAKVELIYTLEQLDDDFEFNVIVYNEAHDYLIQSTKGFIKASAANKSRFIKAIKGLSAGGATNIHGSLIRGFRTTSKNPIVGDPALAKEGFTDGAETIFFLTDGFACYCDGSTSQGPDGMGNGPFATGEKLLPDIIRVNTFRKVVINTVGIGPHDTKLLPALSRSSGGTYRDLSGS